MFFYLVPEPFFIYTIRKRCSIVSVLFLERCIMNIIEFRIFNLKRYSLVGTILYDICNWATGCLFPGYFKRNIIWECSTSYTSILMSKNNNKPWFICKKIMRFWRKSSIDVCKPLNIRDVSFAYWQSLYSSNTIP